MKSSVQGMKDNEIFCEHDCKEFGTCRTFKKIKQLQKLFFRNEGIKLRIIWECNWSEGSMRTRV